MSLIVIAGGPGAPGITTTALGLSLTWPRAVLLADCDREPAQAIPAGYLSGADLGDRGLASLARLHREAQDIATNLPGQTVPLGSESDTPMRRFLPGFAQPGAVRLFEHIWTDLAETFVRFDAQGIDVVVDAGRVGRDGLPHPILASADLVVFVLRSDLKSLAASRLYLPVVTDQLHGLPTDVPLGLAVVGPDRPYSAREISSQFGLRCWFQVPCDPVRARVLSHGAERGRHFDRSPLMAAYRSGGLRLAERIASLRGLRHKLLDGVPYE